MVVFVSELGDLTVGWIQCEDFIRTAHRVALGQHLVADQGYRSVVVVAFSQLLDFSFEVGAVDHACTMPYAGEVEGTAVVCPTIGIHTAFELFGHVSLLAAFDVHDAKAVAVAFVSVTFHALPSDVLTVRRESRVGVVTHVLVCIAFLLAEVSGLLVFEVVEEDVRICRYGISQSFLFAASVGDAL